MKAPRLTQFARGGGCACKIPAGELEQLVAGLHLGRELRAQVLLDLDRLDPLLQLVAADPDLQHASAHAVSSTTGAAPASARRPRLGLAPDVLDRAVHREVPGAP